jgi:fructokinase
MAGLPDALAGANTTAASLEMIDDRTLARILDHAALVAALACERPGADPPTRAQVHQAMHRLEESAFS